MKFIKYYFLFILFIYLSVPEKAFSSQIIWQLNGLLALEREIMAKAPIVKELWMLWNTETTGWVLSVDDPDPYDAYLCAMSFEAIEALQAHQANLYQVKSVPIRII